MGTAAYFYVIEKNGDMGSISLAGIYEAFGLLGMVSKNGEKQFVQSFFDKYNCEIFTQPFDGGPVVSAFTIESPCSDERLWDGMARVLKLGNVVLVCSWKTLLMVGDSAVIPNLPSQLLEDMGYPVVVGTGKEIWDATEYW